MTEPSPPWAVPTQLPEQRRPLDHPKAPDLPTLAAYAPPPAPAATWTATDEGYAHWGLRVAASLLASVRQLPFAGVQVIGLMIAFDGGGLSWVERPGFSRLNDTIAVSAPQVTSDTWIGLIIANLANLGWLVFFIWNTRVRQGRRGASIGKQCMNLMVVSEHDARPIGVFRTWVRSWAHLLDLVTLGIGYLWPLWDRRRQTFADMVMNTAVLHLPPLPPTARIPEQRSHDYGW
jgi:uncharacterized RDD family membrane protein YckC